MFLTEDEIALIESAKEYLTAFLTNYREFHPFAMIMDKKKYIYPLEHEVENEFPNPMSLINLYEQTFYNEIKKEYILGILCINVWIHLNVKGIIKKRNAIEIRIIGINYKKKMVLLYKVKNDKSVIFQEIIGYNAE